MLIKMSDQDPSVAQSLRQATQLLLRAVDRLDSGSPGVRTTAEGLAESVTAQETHTPGPSPTPVNSGGASGGSGLSRSLPIRNSLFQPRYFSGRRRFNNVNKPYETKKWHHSFVCPAKVGHYLPPDTTDRVRLVLGEKKISCSIDAGVDELHHELMTTFPRLKHGGG